MPTLFSSTLIPDITTDARFQAQAQFIEDTFVSTGGWVVAPDINQTLPSALLHPTAVNQKKGFRIYRMSDPLQATAPVFLRIDFGSSNVASTAAFWLTIGTGTDGIGNITGVRFNGGAATNGTVNGFANSTGQPAQPTLSYGSAFHNRAAVGILSEDNVIYAGQHTIVFTIERTKDFEGADTTDGLLLIYKSGVITNGLDLNAYIKNAAGTQPAVEPGLQYILSGQNPSQMFLPGDIGVGIVIHFATIAQQPGTQILVTGSQDVTINGIIKLVLYNHVRTYVHMGLMIAKKAFASGGAGSSADQFARILMRYD